MKRCLLALALLGSFAAFPCPTGSHGHMGAGDAAFAFGFHISPIFGFGVEIGHVHHCVEAPIVVAAIPQVVFLASRGPATDAAAYALGAAAAYGLLTLAVLAALCGLTELAVRRRH